MWAPDNAGMEPVIIERIKDPERLLAQIIECLEQKDSRGLKTYILEHKLKEDSIFWELILKIGECVRVGVSDNHPEFFDSCIRCLMYLVKVGNPKESLLALLEQFDAYMGDVKFKSFLPLVQTALMKMPNKLFHSLDIALEALSSYLESMLLPENIPLEGEELKLFHADKRVVQITDLVEAFLNFLEPFVKAVNLCSENMTKAGRQEALVLKKHLIKLFDRPLCYLILTFDSKTDCAKSDSRLCAEFAMNLLSHLETDFHRLIKNAGLQSGKSKMAEKENEAKAAANAKNEAVEREEHDNQENERKLAVLSTSDIEISGMVENWDFKLEMSSLAAGCLAYLIHVEYLGKEKYPSLYRHDYILECYLDLISILLQNTDYPINYKGLLLLKRLSELVQKSSLPLYYLDNPGYMTALESLVHVMLKCPVRDHRLLATNVFPAFISRFDAGGRHRIYQSVLSWCTHSGVKGYLITLFKNDISNCLKIAKEKREQNATKNHQHEETPRSKSDDLLEFFTGKNLMKVLNLAIKLPEGETSDMLENSDQIISSLNLLRFMVLADSQSSNLTGYWDFMNTIDKNFLSLLRRGLDLSKAHYELELNNMKEGKPAMTGDGKGMEMSLSVGNGSLPALERKEKIELLERAVNTHHVMHSLLCRVSELIDQKK